MKIVSVLEALSLLQSGDILAYPTDTVWGLGGLANKEVIEKINSLKKRAGKAGFILITDDRAKLIPLVKSPDDLDLIPETSSPTSWLVDVSEKFKFLTTTEKVALRLVKAPSILCELLTELDRPLLSTSLNISGNPTIQTMSAIPFDIAVLPFCEPLVASPSRIIDLSNGRIIR